MPVLVTVHDVPMRVMLVFMVVIVMIVTVFVLRAVEMLVFVLVIAIDLAFFRHIGRFGAKPLTHSVLPAG